MSQELRSIGAVSCAKMLAALYASVGFLIGGVFFLVFSVFAVAGRSGALGSDVQSGPFGFLLGFGSILFFPIFYGLLGAIGGLIAAGLYNVLAKYVGGIKVEIG